MLRDLKIKFAFFMICIIINAGGAPATLIFFFFLQRLVNNLVNWIK